MSELQVEYEEVADGLAAALRCRGVIDAHTYNQMESALAFALDQGSKRIIIDLSGVSFLASRALGLFLNARKVLETRDGVLVLVAPTQAVRDAITVLGFDSLFPIAPTEAEAIAAEGDEAR